MTPNNRKKYEKPELTKLQSVARMTMAMLEEAGKCSPCWNDTSTGNTCRVCGGTDIRSSGHCKVCQPMNFPGSCF